MVKLIVTAADASVKELDVPAGEPLMYSLRDNNMGIEAICGGACACATCHVFVEEPWFSTLPPLTGDEDALLGMLTCRQPNSRLSCQIEVTPALEGAKVTIGGSE